MTGYCPECGSGMYEIDEAGENRVCHDCGYQEAFVRG